MEDYAFERLYPQGLLCRLDDVPEGHGAIYLITNLINGKVYVGQTWVGISSRWRGHLSAVVAGSDSYFHNAIRKYGAENFTLGILGCAYTQPELDALEDLWIVVCNSRNPKTGYNQRGGGSTGKLNEEVKEKLSIKGKERWADPIYAEKMKIIYDSPDRRALISKNSTLYWSSQEARDEQAVVTAELWQNPEYRDKVTAKLSVLWETPGFRENIVAKGVERWSDPLEREKQSARMILVQANPEVKQKQSAARSEKWAIPGAKKEMSETIKKFWSDPVNRERMSQSMKGVKKRKK